MHYHGINISPEEIAEFCRRHRIRKLAFFGSVLRDDFRQDSDIDVLIEFEQGVSVGLRFFAIERELSDLIGRKVDFGPRFPLTGRSNWFIMALSFIHFCLTGLQSRFSFFCWGLVSPRLHNLLTA